MISRYRRTNRLVMLLALLSQYAVQLTKLALSTTTLAEPFLCIIDQPIILCGAVQSLVNYFEEERELCADARNRPKLWHQKGRQLFGDIASHSSSPFAWTHQ